MIHHVPVYRRGLAGWTGRRGMAIVYVTAVMVVLILICSLAVDYGRVQLVKMELQRAADAAARYAVTGLSDGTTLSKANYIASQNTADGTAVVLVMGGGANDDVVSGHWDPTTATFTAGGRPWTRSR